MTKPSDLVEADEGAAEDHESLVDVGAPLVADCQPAEAIELGQRSLDDPAASAPPFAVVDVSPDNTGHYGTLAPPYLNFSSFVEMLAR